MNRTNQLSTEGILTGVILSADYPNTLTGQIFPMTIFIHRLPEKVFVTFTLISYASKFDSGVTNKLVSVYQGNAGKKLDFKSKLQSTGSLYRSNVMGLIHVKSPFNKATQPVFFLFFTGRPYLTH